MALRLLTHGAVLAAALAAAPASAATVTAAATVTINKPLVLSKLNDLSFGTVTLGSATGTVRISQQGVVTCPAGATCTGAVAAAGFNIQGSNKLTALITVPSANLTNGTDSLAFTPEAPSSIYLPNSGAPGIDFYVGGSVSIGPSNAGGTYSGTISVTAEYQ